MTSLTRTHLAELNDAFRTTFVGGAVMLTSSVAALSAVERATILRKVRGFSAFTEDNDPRGEHDCAVISIDDRTIIWKIDYYDPTMREGSEDPTDPDKTRRVLTIMLAEEY